MIYPVPTTTPTTFGPAVYHVSADGLLSLSWPDGLTIHRVEYSSASAYQSRDRYDTYTRANAHLYRAQGIKPPSFAAQRALLDELARLAPLLCTPEAAARTAVFDAERRAQDADSAAAKAQEAHASARAVLESARAALAALEVRA